MAFLMVTPTNFESSTLNVFLSLKADFNIGSDEGQSAVTIKFVDSNGRDISDQKQEEIKQLQELDENDLGLAHDFNKIFNS